MELSSAPLPVGAPRHETQQPPHRYATGYARETIFTFSFPLILAFELTYTV